MSCRRSEDFGLWYRALLRFSFSDFFPNPRLASFGDRCRWTPEQGHRLERSWRPVLSHWYVHTICYSSAEFIRPSFFPVLYPSFLTSRTFLPDNFYRARHRLSFANNNLLIRVTTSTSFQGHVIDSVNCSIGLSMPHFRSFFGSTLHREHHADRTRSAPISDDVSPTKPALNLLFCNDKKAESRQHPCNSHSKNAPCLQQGV